MLPTDPVGALSQPRAFGAFLGGRYGDFTRQQAPVRITQVRAFGAFTGARYGSFAGRVATEPPTPEVSAGGPIREAVRRRELRRQIARAQRPWELPQFRVEEQRITPPEARQRQVAESLNAPREVPLSAVSVVLGRTPSAPTSPTTYRAPLTPTAVAAAQFAADIASELAAQAKQLADAERALRTKERNNRVAILTTLLLSQH